MSDKKKQVKTNRLAALYADHQRRVQELIPQVLSVDSIPSEFPIDTRERLEATLSSLIGKPVSDILQAVTCGLRFINGDQPESIMHDLMRIGISIETAVFLARIRWALEEDESNRLPILLGAGATKSAAISARRSGQRKNAQKKRPSAEKKAAERIYNAQRLAGMDPSAKQLSRLLEAENMNAKLRTIETWLTEFRNTAKTTR